MNVVYFINQYPKASHAFIRREIVALEATRVKVLRVAVRRTSEALADPSDRTEAQRTGVLLDHGKSRLMMALVATVFARPIRFARAVRAAARLARNSKRGPWIHWVYLAESCLLLQITQSERSDHLHAHFGTNPAAVAHLCSVLGGPGYSFTVHGPEEFDHPEALSLKEKIARAHFVVAISEFGRSQLFRWARPEDWKKIHVVHCGVDESFLGTPPTRPSAAPRLVCVGRLCRDKGQTILMKAAAEMIAEGIPLQLILIGDGPLRGELEEMVRVFGLAESVEFRGWQSGEAIRKELLNSRGLVLPSFAEGLPVVLMESLALCRPVITTQIAGIPELVKHRENGWLIPPGNVEALVEAMREMLAASPERLLEMGKAGAERVREQHDAKKEAAKLAELFRRYTGLEQSPAQSPAQNVPSKIPVGETAGAGV